MSQFIELTGTVLGDVRLRKDFIMAVRLNPVLSGTHIDITGLDESVQVTETQAQVMALLDPNYYIELTDYSTQASIFVHKVFVNRVSSVVIDNADVSVVCIMDSDFMFYVDETVSAIMAEIDSEEEP